MADGSVIFETGLDTGGLSKALGGIGSVAKGAGKTFAAGFKGVSIALGAVTTGLGFLAKTAVTYNNSMEQYTTNFGVMLGDEAAAIEHVAELREMAAKTPFGMSELADASQTMLSFGMDAETTKTAMQQLGDISLGNKERFGQLSLAFAQVSAAGKLTGQDLLQMVNAGFNPLQTIAEKTGTNLGDLKDVMAGKKGSKEFRKQLKAAQKEVKKMGENASEGAKMLVQLGEDGYISAEMIGKAMEIETSPGGRFYNGMQKASETFSGMVSTLQDDATNLIGKVFEPLTNSMKTNMLPLAQKYIGALETAFDESGTEGLATALGTVLGDAVTKVSEALPDVLTLASNLLTAVATGLTDNADKIAGGISNAITAIASSDLPETAITSIGTLAGTLVTKLADGLSGNASSIIGGITSGISKLLDGGQVGEIATSALKLATSLVTGIGDNLPELLPSLATGIVDGIATAFTSLPGLFTAAGNLVSGLQKGLFGEDGTSGAVGTLAQSILDGINGFFETNFPELGIKLPGWESISAEITKSWNELLPNFVSMLETKLGIKLPEFKELEESAQELKNKLVEFFKVTATITLKPIDPSGENPFSEKEDPFAYNVYKEAQFVLQNYKETTWSDLWSNIFPSAGAEGIAEQATEIANETVAEMDKALLAAFQNGEISYEELVAARFGEGMTGENGAMQTLATESVTSLSEGIEQDGAVVSTSVESVISAAKTAANTSQFSSVGAQIAGGIAKGISNGTSVVVAAVNRLIQKALAAAESAADIHSPSRLFAARIGEPIAAGTAVGVSNGSYLLRRAVTDMVKASIPDMRGVASGIINSGNAGYGSAAMAGGFNQTNNFNVPVVSPDEFADTMRMYATYGLQGEG